MSQPSLATTMKLSSSRHLTTFYKRSPSFGRILVSLIRILFTSHITRLIIPYKRFFTLSQKPPSKTTFLLLSVLPSSLSQVFFIQSIFTTSRTTSLNPLVWKLHDIRTYLRKQSYNAFLFPSIRTTIFPSLLFVSPPTKSKLKKSSLSDLQFRSTTTTPYMWT